MIGAIVGAAARILLPRAAARLVLWVGRVRLAKRILGWGDEDPETDREEAREDLGSAVLWREAQDELEDEEDREDLTGPL